MGPQSAGADPGPAAYGHGGADPTVTDANVVLGYLPAMQKLGGDMTLDRELSMKAVQKIAAALKLSLDEAAQGIYDIVNENMVGALRLVSVEQGYDPRDFALMAFGGAGPLHANALARLLGSWPAIIPPGPGVLCALGDASTSVRDERARTYIKSFSMTNAKELVRILKHLSQTANKSLVDEGVEKREITTEYQVDVRYRGQGLRLTIPIDLAALETSGLKAIAGPFDAEHKRLFTFALELEHEIVTLRASVQGRGIRVRRSAIPNGTKDARAAVVGSQVTHMDGKRYTAPVYNRSRLKSGNVIAGPAIVVEMDSTTVILPKHQGRVDPMGNILIYPVGFVPRRNSAARTARTKKPSSRRK